MTHYLNNWRNWVAGLGVLAIIIASSYGFGYAAAWVSPTWIFAALIGSVFAMAIFYNPIIGMYLLAFFLPFERIGSVDIAGITVRVSQVIALLTISAWVTHNLRKRSFPLQPNPTWIPVSIFILICTLGLLEAPFLSRSVSVLIFTVFTISVSLLIPNLVQTSEQLTRIITILFISMLLVSLFGLFQFSGDLVGLPNELTGLRSQYTKEVLGFPRIQSTALEPLYFANYLLIPLGIALAFFLAKSKRIKPTWLLAVLSLGTLNLVLTVSRGGYIAFAATVICLGLWYWREAFRPRNIITILLVVAIVGGLAFRFLNAGEQITNFTKHVTNLFDGASYVERVDTFSIAYDIWQKYPLIGIGPGSFGPYASQHPLMVPSAGYRIVNNEYIELLAETGILGLGAFILLMLIVIIRSFKAYHATRNNDSQRDARILLVGCCAALAGILVQYNTFSILYIMHIWWLLGIMIATQNILLRSGNHVE